MREFYTVFPVLLEQDIRDEDHIIDEAGQTFYNLTPYISSSDLASWTAFLADVPPCDPIDGPWIMGGAVRRFLQGQPQDADIDLFFDSSAQYDLYHRLMVHMGHGLLAHTEHHTMFEVRSAQSIKKVQLVTTRYRESLIDHMNAFDYTLCQTGWDGERVIASYHALIDIVDQKLNLASTTLHDLPSSWFRILKYAQQGYHPSQKTINYFMQHAHEVTSTIDQVKTY